MAKETGEMTGIERIARERRRQVEEEGWTPEHDDKHERGSLARVAALYAMPAPFRHEQLLGAGISGRLDLVDRCWPTNWHSSWWKPTPDDRLRELEKAGALIAAEIDRILRAREAP